MERGKTKFGDYLNRMFAEWFTPYWYNKNGEAPDDHDFADYLGISDQAYSQYKLGKRRATIAVAEQLADKLNDPRVYDALDYPRRMPKDALSILFVENVHVLNEQDKTEIVALIEKRREEKEAKKRQRNTKAYA